MRKLPFYLYIFANFIVAYAITFFFMLCIIVSCESQKDIDEKFEREKAKMDSVFSADSVRNQQIFDSIKKVPIEKILKPFGNIAE